VSGPQVMTTPADEGAFYDAAGEVGAALSDREVLYAEDGNSANAETAAYVYAAGRHMGLSHTHARWLTTSTGVEDISDDEWSAIIASAERISDPWGWLDAHTGAYSARLKSILRRYEGTGVAETEVSDVDFDAPPQPPDWVVPGIAARGRRTLLSAAHSGSKTSLIAGIVKAAVSGEDFLGQPVNAERILIYSGEESADQLAAEKLAPMGVRNEHKPAIRIVGRGGFARLGTPEGDAAFIAQVEAFRPDLVVLDTSGTVIAVNPLDNEAVTEVYERTLNPVCDRVGAALLFTHHHRKGGASGNQREAALGAVQWENQADFVVTIRCVKPYAETPTGDGHVQTNSTFVMRWPKGRGGLVDAPFPYEIHGEKDAPAPKGATLSLELRLPTAELTDAEQIAAVVEGETARKAIAEALPWGGDGTGTKFRDALKAAEDEQLIFKVSKGIYSDTPAAG
jgi:AAA domain-containing protein